MEYKMPIRPLSLLTVLAVLLTFPPAALAYLDPSTGSMVVSAIVGIFASIALAVKTYWYKIKGLFRREDKSQADNGESAE
jgi:hypothetical protein